MTETELQKAEIKRLSHTHNFIQSEGAAEICQKKPVLTMVFLGNIILLKIRINS